MKRRESGSTALATFSRVVATGRTRVGRMGRCGACVDESRRGPTCMELPCTDCRTHRAPRILRLLTWTHTLATAGMSTCAFRYVRRPERTVSLQALIVALAHRHRRNGSSMFYLE